MCSCLAFLLSWPYREVRVSELECRRKRLAPHQLKTLDAVTVVGRNSLFLPKPASRSLCPFPAEVPCPRFHLHRGWADEFVRYHVAWHQQNVAETLAIGL